jgi:hypothetical protein
MLFSDPYIAGLAVQYSLHAMVLIKVFPFPPFYQFLVYAVILHSCSHVAHIKVAEAQSCIYHACSLGSQTACTLCTSCTLSGVIVHCLHCLHSFTGTHFSSIGFAIPYKMSFRRQEKSRKVTLVGQSHLRNP